MMTRSLHAETGSRPEAMADVPGVCELPVTRAVVQYRDLHDVELAGGRIEDIGLALVLEGRYAARAQAIDLGSAEVKQLDLSTELVVLDWVYEPTLEHVSSLLERRSRAGEDAADDQGLTAYCFDLALRVLDRVGFGPLSRPVVLRIGFRDICRDLDLHEGTSVRIVTAAGRVVRAFLDYDAAALRFRSSTGGSDPALEGALQDAFAGREVLRVEDTGGGPTVSYRVRFPLPVTLGECRAILHGMRRGLDRLMARFEPERHRALEDVLSTLGRRRTLERLHRLSEREVRTVRLPEARDRVRRETVH